MVAWGWRQHGFARNVSWEICSTGSECGSAFVVLPLCLNSHSNNILVNNISLNKISKFMKFLL